MAADIVNPGGNAVAIQGDARKSQTLRPIKKAFGGADAPVNNAGICERLLLDAVTGEHFHRQFNLNKRGLLPSTQEAVKHFGA